MNRLRIGCVPYLNGKPLIDWLHEPECDAPVEVIYAVPSELAAMLERGELDAALVSIFEVFRHPELRIVPNISISADGAVKSVRLFSCVPFPAIRRVALDTSSLTSTALIRILLKEQFGLSPDYVPHPPDLGSMLDTCDAGLIIGDLKLFDSPATHILDLGAAWKELTGLPFVYAAWLARPDAPLTEVTNALAAARDWGIRHLDGLSRKWSARMSLPGDRVHDYFRNVMQYDLDDAKWRGLLKFQERCAAHGLIERIESLQRA